MVAEGGSPFVLIFQSLNSNGVANVLNFVVLIAAISVYNSCIYCNSRMLHGLAEQGNAPAILKKVNSRGIPVPAAVVSASITAVCGSELLNSWPSVSDLYDVGCGSTCH